MGMAPELVADYQGSGSCSNIIIDSCSVIASSTYGAGIGGSKQCAGSDITINNASVNASSTGGAGIGGGYGYGGSCENITINGGSVKASSVSGSPKTTKMRFTVVLLTILIL